MNSMTAIGSGRLIGKGLHVDESSTLLGTGFISESQTDFIFAVIGEQLGFLGCCIMIILISVIAVRCYMIASKSSSIRDQYWRRNWTPSQYRDPASFCKLRAHKPSLPVLRSGTCTEY